MLSGKDDLGVRFMAAGLSGKKVRPGQANVRMALTDPAGKRTSPLLSADHVATAA